MCVRELFFFVYQGVPVLFNKVGILIIKDNMGNEYLFEKPTVKLDDFMFKKMREKKNKNGMM